LCDEFVLLFQEHLLLVDLVEVELLEGLLVVSRRGKCSTHGRVLVGRNLLLEVDLAEVTAAHLRKLVCGLSAAPELFSGGRAEDVRLQLFRRGLLVLLLGFQVHERDDWLLLST